MSKEPSVHSGTDAGADQVNPTDQDSLKVGQPSEPWTVAEDGALIVADGWRLGLERLQSITVSRAHNAEVAALEAKLRELARQNDEDGDFMAFMTGELARFECLHGKDHEGTMPMMWPELIACIRAKGIEDATAALRSQLSKMTEALRRIVNTKSVEWSESHKATVMYDFARAALTEAAGQVDTNDAV